MPDSKQDLEEKVLIAARDNGVSSVLFRNAIGRKLGLNVTDAQCLSLLTIKGIYGREMYETWYKMTVMLESGLDIKPVITHRYHYTEFEKGFELMKTGQSGKVVLQWQ